MDSEKIILPYDMGGNGLFGNGMSGNGAEFCDNNFLLSSIEFEKLTQEFDKSLN